ncbi:MAG: hypothetical protein JWM56_324 [Candidatus Peribacteria bacterium]|nr:hypothetical protein [Candidatus Peribacteria bacterium]
MIAGMSTLGLAVPILAQVSNAASTSSLTGTTSSTTVQQFTRPVPTQAEVQARATQDQAFLDTIDAMVVIQKKAMQVHKDALTAAAGIADDTARQQAVQAANDAMRTTIQNAITANPALKSAMMGDHGFGGGHEGFGRGPGDLAAKLGMTAAELKTALDSGKTVEQIATEKGITLPARGQFRNMSSAAATSSTTTNQ